MIREGHVVLFRFPQTDQSRGKLRPALVVRKLPGQRGEETAFTMIRTAHSDGRG